MQERRANPRYRVWFPVTLVLSGQETTAITHDVSTTGGMLASPSAVAPQSAVTLRFQLDLDHAPRSVEATVLRCEPDTYDRDGPWRYRLAVQFIAPQPDLERILVAASEADDGG